MGCLARGGGVADSSAAWGQWLCGLGGGGEGVGGLGGEV